MRRLFSRIPAAAVSVTAARFNATDAPVDPKVEQMAEAYSQLTLKEISQLQRLIFKKLGHSDKFYEEALLKGLGGGGGGAVVMAAAPAAAPAADAAAAAAEAPKAAEPAKKKIEKTTADVKLVKFPAEAKIKLIKELRTVTNLPLKDAKDAIDKAPGLIQTNMSKEDAEKLKKLLEGHGAEVELL